MHTHRKIKAMSTVCTHSQSKQRDRGLAPRGDCTEQYQILQKYCLTIRLYMALALERHILCTLLTAALQSRGYRGRLESCYTHRQEQENNQTGELTLHRKNTVQGSTETMANWTELGCLHSDCLFLWFQLGFDLFFALHFCFNPRFWSQLSK